MLNSPSNKELKATTIEDETPSSSSTNSSVNKNNNNNNVMRQRPTRVSVHRLTKNRIRQDSMENMRQKHEVPHLVNNNGGGSNDGDNSHASFLRNAHKHPWVEKHISSTILHNQLCRRSCRQWMETLLPCTSWLAHYDYKSTLLQDVIAGLTVGVMIIPQSMSYAKLAGLPVEYGLYSALVPVYMYGIFGSSRQLAVGPVALISLLLATGLNLILDSQGITPETHPDSYTTIYTTLAVQTSFLVGLTYLLMGLLRLGFVTIFLSHAVISGFTTGAAVIIGMSQLKYFLGYDVLKSDRLHILIQRIIQDIDQFNYKTFLVGALSTLTLVVLKHVGKTYPRFKFVRALGPLTVTILAILVQVIWDLESLGIPIVGHIPKGFPDVTINLWTPLGGEEVADQIDTSQLFVMVISIAIVGFMESIAIAKQLASKHNYELDSSLELMGLGMANLVGAGMFQGYPVTGSFSRSAVNNESGAQSGISGMVTATLVGLALLFLTPVFEQLVSTVKTVQCSAVQYTLLHHTKNITSWMDRGCVLWMFETTNVRTT
jgi:sulfate transporter 4